MTPEPPPLEGKAAQLHFRRWQIQSAIRQDAAIDDEVDELLVDGVARVAVETLAHDAQFFGMTDAIADAKVIEQALEGFRIGEDS